MFLFSFLFMSFSELPFSLCSSLPLRFQNQLSGNLLRKFKNSNGWQKLWVVFTNFSLFFYKSHQVCQSAVEWETPSRCVVVKVVKDKSVAEKIMTCNKRWWLRVNCPRGSSVCRTTILWQAFLCWATPSPSPWSQKTSTKITSLNFTSNPTSTTSDQRASTLLKGTSILVPGHSLMLTCLVKQQLHYDINIIILCNKFELCLSTDGINKTYVELLDLFYINNQVFVLLVSRWMEVIRSATCSASRSLPSTRKDLYWWICFRLLLCPDLDFRPHEHQKRLLS